MFAPVISANDFKSAISALSAIVDEATLKFTKEGMESTCISASKIGLVHIQYPSIAFKNYVCDEEVLVTVQLTELLKFLGKVSKNEDIELSVVQNELQLLLKGTRYKNPMRIKCLTQESANIANIPKVNFTTRVKLTTDAFVRAIDDTRIVSDDVKFIANKKEFKMKSEGTLGKMEPTFELGNSEAILELSCTEKSEASATYSLTMLNDIVSQCKGMSDVVILEFGSNLPLRVEFGLLCGMLEYYLAPKVEEIE